MWWGQTKAINALLRDISPPLTIIRGKRINMVPGVTSAKDVMKSLDNVGIFSPPVSSTSTVSSTPFPLSSFSHLTMMNSSETRQEPLATVPSTPHEVVTLSLGSLGVAKPRRQPEEGDSSFHSHRYLTPDGSTHHTAVNPISVRDLANNIVQDIEERIDRIVKLDALCSGVCSRSARQGVSRGLLMLKTIADGGVVTSSLDTKSSNTIIMFSPVYSPTESFLEALASVLNDITVIGSKYGNSSSMVDTPELSRYTRPHLVWLPSPICTLSSGVISSILLNHIYGDEIKGMITQPIVNESIECQLKYPYVMDFSVLYSGSILAETVLNSCASIVPKIHEEDSSERSMYRVKVRGASDYIMSFPKLLQEKEERPVEKASKCNMNNASLLHRSNLMHLDVALPNSIRHRCALVFTPSPYCPPMLSQQSIKAICSLCAEHAFYRHGGQSPFTSRYVYVPKQWVGDLIQELVQGHLKGVTRAAEKGDNLISTSTGVSDDKHYSTDFVTGHALDPRTKIGPLYIEGAVKATLSALDEITSYTGDVHGGNDGTTTVRTVAGGFSPVMPNGEGKSFICPTIMYVKDKSLLSNKSMSLKGLRSTMQTANNERIHPIWTTNIAAPVLFIIPYKMNNLLDDVVAKHSIIQSTAGVQRNVLENFFFYLTGGYSSYIDNVSTVTNNDITDCIESSVPYTDEVYTFEDEVYALNTTIDDVCDREEFVATILKRKEYGDTR